jgi:uncharacterized membrane protein YfcA
MSIGLALALLALGACVGFLAGLLGIGGGMTMVPTLTFLYTQLGFPTEDVVHIAVATATASICFTAFSSAREHDRHGAVRWHVVRGMAPGMILGSLAGPQLVSRMSTGLLSSFFGAFVIVAATQILIDRKPAPTRELPGIVVLAAVGATIGFVSSMVGAGGAFLSVPFMTWCNVRIREAVATSAALGFPIAAAGTLGYVLAGWGRGGLPAYTVGFVHVPSLAAIVVTSMLAAPAGARLAHRWPAQRLRRAFALLLYALALYMLWKGASPWIHAAG